MSQDVVYFEVVFGMGRGGRGNPGLAKPMGEKEGWTDSVKMKYSI